MIIGLQLIGLLFGLVMCYLTFIYYKRKNYDLEAFIFWLVIWLGFIILALFPSSVYGLMEQLKIQRTVDFFVIGGFLLFSVILFKVYTNTKKNQKQIEEIVRKLALKKAEKEQKNKNQTATVPKKAKNKKQ
jgi:hypothetical protein